MPTLNFKGKTAVESYHLVVPHHVLEFDSKLSLSQEPSLDDNLIIEGDNLLALKALLPTHAGKVKCVYIDPPYNTGNEGWIYNDNLTQPQFKEWGWQGGGKGGRGPHTARQVVLHDVSAVAAFEGAAVGGRLDLGVHRRQRSSSLANALG
jgi:hypothetical protein